MKELSLIETLSNAFGVSGYEDEVKDIIYKELENYELEIIKDNLGSIIFKSKGMEQDTKKILITAHIDEVGFITERITPDGLIKFLPIGGWFEQTLLSQRVIIKNNKGDKLNGMILSIPKHFLTDDKKHKPLGIADMFIDIGATSRAEVEDDFQITPGCPIVPDSTFTQLSENRFMGKALDDRLGVAILIQILKEFSELPHKYDIYGAFTVQEEVGARGATTVANLIKPDIALILEAAPSDDIPGIPSSPLQGVLGNGCQIRLYDPTMLVNPKLAKSIINIAEEENIEYQIAVRRSGGTDGKQIHISNYGVPTIVLGVPSRSIHSHNSIADINDYYSTLKLAINFINQINDDFIESL